MGGQEQRDVLRNVWGLQGFAVVEVETEEAAVAGRPPIKLIRIRDLREGHQCPECGKSHRELAFQEAEERRWRERSMGDFESWVVYTPWRVFCCGGTRVERMPWESPGHRMTRHFFELIVGLCRRLAISEVARMARLSWTRWRGWTRSRSSWRWEGPLPLWTACAGSEWTRSPGPADMSTSRW